MWPVCPCSTQTPMSLATPPGVLLCCCDVASSRALRLSRRARGFQRARGPGAAHRAALAEKFQHATTKQTTTTQNNRGPKPTRARVPCPGCMYGLVWARPWLSLGRGLAVHEAGVAGWSDRQPVGRATRPWGPRVPPPHRFRRWACGTTRVRGCATSGACSGSATGPDGH